MIIFTQDKKHLIDCNMLSVEKNFGGNKDSKYAIIATGGFNIGATIIGYYPDEKTAIDQLEKIYAAFADGAKAYSA